MRELKKVEAPDFFEDQIMEHAEKRIEIREVNPIVRHLMGYIPFITLFIVINKIIKGEKISFGINFLGRKVL